MRLSNPRLFTFLTGVLLSAASLPAAEIGLSGTDPTIPLPDNPPTFSFTTDKSGLFSAEYMNTSGFTFLNLKITGPADNITSVGCSPDSVFTACSASIDTKMDTVTFLFSGGPGITNLQSFFLTAQHFPQSETLFGTSTNTVGAPEPASIFTIAAGLAVSALFMRRRQLLKLHIARK